MSSLVNYVSHWLRSLKIRCCESPESQVESPVPALKLSIFPIVFICGKIKVCVRCILERQSKVFWHKREPSRVHIRRWQAVFIEKEINYHLL